MKILSVIPKAERISGDELDASEHKDYVIGFKKRNLSLIAVCLLMGFAVLSVLANVVLNILVYIEVTKADQNITVQHNSKEFDGDPITAADLGLSYRGNGNVTLEFKLSTDPDSAYSSSYSPNAAHEYSVRITVAESDYYREGVIVVTFTIYMPE